MSKNKKNNKKEMKDEEVLNEQQSEETVETQEEKQQEEKNPIEELQQQVEEYKDKYLRSVAEFDNYRKHTLKEKAELILNGGEKTIVAMLPVIDDMERAIANNAKSDDIEAIKEGFNLIYQKFVKTLEGMGVKKIDTTDADFDTEFHNAIAMLPMGDDKKGKVIDCVKTGYTLNDKVIRHADVAVG
ncbi:MAG: nucleotide exchange factor GrpE, partial [Prevotellaceae bacterium]|nr:nucleotide exchange factor GrpE [Prevotellaceae bacterium]